VEVNKVEFFFEEIPAFEFNQRIVVEGVQNIILQEKKKVGFISVIFCSDDYLLEVNKKFLDHHYYTDIITFDYVEDKLISGDLFISVDRIKENAPEFGVSFFEELLRVVFHGVLHLIGYDDRNETERKEIRSKEDFYLKTVDIGEGKDES